jgi:hypothetical protein
MQALKEIPPQHADMRKDEQKERQQEIMRQEKKKDDRFYDWEELLEERKRKIDEEEKIEWERNKKASRLEKSWELAKLCRTYIKDNSENWIEGQEKTRLRQEEREELQERARRLEKAGEKKKLVQTKIFQKKIRMKINQLDENGRKGWEKSEEEDRRRLRLEISENMENLWAHRGEDKKKGERILKREEDLTEKLGKLDALLDKMKKESEEKRKEKLDEWREKIKEKDAKKMRLEKKRSLEEKWRILRIVTNFIKENQEEWLDAGKQLQSAEGSKSEKNLQLNRDVPPQNPQEKNEAVKPDSRTLNVHGENEAVKPQNLEAKITTTPPTTPKQKAVFEAHTTPPTTPNKQEFLDTLQPQNQEEKVRVGKPNEAVKLQNFENDIYTPLPTTPTPPNHHLPADVQLTEDVQGDVHHHLDIDLASYMFCPANNRRTDVKTDCAQKYYADDINKRGCSLRLNRKTVPEKDDQIPLNSKVARARQFFELFDMKKEQKNCKEKNEKNENGLLPETVPEKKIFSKDIFAEKLKKFKFLEKNMSQDRDGSLRKKENDKNPKSTQNTPKKKSHEKGGGL